MHLLLLEGTHTVDPIEVTLITFLLTQGASFQYTLAPAADVTTRALSPYAWIQQPSNSSSSSLESQRRSASSRHPQGSTNCMRQGLMLAHHPHAR